MVQLRPAQTSRFHRDAWLEINLGNLEYNLKTIYSWFKKPLIPVLKADAYGHGAVVLVKVLDTYDYVHAYAVASVDEALSLREITKKKIFVLGISPEWAIKEAINSKIGLTVVSLEMAYKINEIAKELKTQAAIHLKLDTGMNRIGFKETLPIDELEKLQNIKIDTLYTHFVDPSNIEFTQRQAEDFKLRIQGLPYQTHIASTKASKILNSDSDYVRCGIELYGLENPELKPLMSLYARINFIKNINAGESVSYKRSWVAEADTRIATLPLGYADGIPRALSNKIFAYCKDQKIKQVGLVTMDQIMFDIGLNNEIQVGDTVELIGPHIPISDWTRAANTISYEIVCGLNLRLPKVYAR